MAATGRRRGRPDYSRRTAGGSWQCANRLLPASRGMCYSRALPQDALITMTAGRAGANP